MSGGGDIPIKLDKKSQLPLYVVQRALKLEYELPIGKIRGFFEGLKQGKVMATKCPKCGKIYFPPQHECVKCKTETEWFELSGEAELLTYTIINVKPKTFSHYKDYIIAIGRLKEGINVLAWLDADPKGIKIGMKLRLIVAKREQEGYLTYHFVPEK